MRNAILLLTISAYCFLFGLHNNSAINSTILVSWGFFFSFPSFPVTCFFQVMLAASYWSLLAPAIDMAEDSGKYGSFAFLPVAVGFTLGAAFVYFADLAMPLLVRT